MLDRFGLLKRKKRPHRTMSACPDSELAAAAADVRTGTALPFADMHEPASRVRAYPESESPNGGQPCSRRVRQEPAESSAPAHIISHHKVTPDLRIEINAVACRPVKLSK
jgi:hypothetical protein